MINLFIAILVFILNVSLTFLNGYWLITLDELELDHLNPADVSRRLNRLVYPEIVLHGLLLLLCIFGHAPWILLLNIPLAGWHAWRISRNEQHLDPTEILRFKNLRATRMQAITRTIFYGLQIIYGMFWMVSAIVLNARGSKTKKI